jgi:MazG family protein
LDVIAKLRDPEEGCPWDLKQTFQSLRSMLLEEGYEVVDAVDTGDPAGTCEELGDVLSIIALYAQIASEQRLFSFSQIIKGITDKLIRRHPHIFGDVKVSDAEEVVKNWNAIKQQERSTAGSPVKGLLDNIPKSMPALQRAHEIGLKAAKVGFDWSKPSDVASKVREEVEEFVQEATNLESDRSAHAALSEELGDLFFSLAQLARHLKINPEECLGKANQKFLRRFAYMEDLVRTEAPEKSLENFSTAELELLWERAKKAQSS